MGDNPFLDAAQAYLAAGLHPIPVEPRGKRPLIGWAPYKTVAPTVRDLNNWWADTPDANVGLVMGRGVFVLDVDDNEGLDALNAAGIDLDPWRFTSVATGRGAHFYFRGVVPDRIGLLPKVDVRSGGGFVVAPPSIHENGKLYRWWVGELPAGFPAAPPALLELFTRPTRPTPGATVTADGWLSVALSGVGEGGRDVTCTRLAGYFLGKGVPADVVEQLLTQWGERCSPEFGAADVAKCVASVAKRRVGLDVPEGVAAAPAPIADVVAAAMLEINRTPEERKRSMRSTALPSLDHYLAGGFEAGELVYIGGPPGTGKTAFVLRMVKTTAETHTGVLCVSREMRAAALGRRLLVQTSGVPLSDVKRGTLNDKQRADLAGAQTYLSGLPIHVSAAASVRAIREHLATFGPGEIGLVVIDYLQLLNGDAEDKRIRVEEISKELKATAIDLSIPIVCISSLRRMSKTKDGSAAKPDIHDLRESGSLEFDGDVVLLLHREFGSDLCEVVVGKARDGRVGVVKLRFYGDTMRFEECPA